MPTKNEIKFIHSLKQKKVRNNEKLFVAEGEKLVRHFLELGLSARFVFCLPNISISTDQQTVSDAEMKKLTLLQHHSPAMAVFAMPKFANTKLEIDFTLLLDGVRDPGNMGTILRLCDWFGVPQILCTDDCVDVFNEKVVQASMGSVAAVQVIKNSREKLLEELLHKNVELIGTEMHAAPIYDFTYPRKCALVLGNEGRGISEELQKHVRQNISIPAAKTTKAESLNVANAAAVLLSDYARKH